MVASSNEQRNGDVTRRRFLRVAAGATVFLPGLLAACTAPAPPAPTASAGAAAGAASKPGSVLPTFVPLQGGPKPDHASAGQQYEDGWDLYPFPPIKAWTKAPPGAGSTVSVFSNAFNPPSTPYDQNPAWQEINKQLNANVQFTVVAPGDYAAKMGTVMAGDDLPDVMLFPGG
jgi:putative aldouronate transport system substrate-binding protein